MGRILTKYWFVFSDIFWLFGFFYLMYVQDTGTHYPHMVGAFFVFILITGFITWIATLCIILHRILDD